MPRGPQPKRWGGWGLGQGTTCQTHYLNIHRNELSQAPYSEQPTLAHLGLPPHPRQKVLPVTCLILVLVLHYFSPPLATKLQSAVNTHKPRDLLGS